MEGKGMVERVGHVVLLHLLGMAITRHIKSGVLGPRLSTVPFCTTSISSQLRSPWNEIAKKYAVPLHRSLSARTKEKKIDMLLSNAWHNNIQYFRICLTLCQSFFFLIFPKTSTKPNFISLGSLIYQHHMPFSFTSAYKSKNQNKPISQPFFSRTMMMMMLWKKWAMMEWYGNIRWCRDSFM